MKSLLSPITALILALVVLGVWAIIGRVPSGASVAHIEPEPQTWVVCPQGPPTCRFSKIQAAIDTVPEGAILSIRSGTYEENLLIRKSLTLQAAEGEQVVVKSATDSLPTLLLVSGRPIQVGVMGLTILAARQYQGNGIEVMGLVAARIERNTIQDHQWGILVLGKVKGLDPLSDLTVVINENTIIRSGIVILQSAKVIVSKNSIQGSKAPVEVGGAGIAIGFSWDVVASDNLFEGGSVMWISQSWLIEITRNINIAFIYIEGSRVSLSDNQIGHNGWGVAIESKSQGPLDSLVSLTGNRITQQELYGLVVADLDYVSTCRGNHIRDNKRGDYRVQSPTISFFGPPNRDPAAEEKLRKQCEGG